jgi:putative MATE family efflux protein
VTAIATDIGADQARVEHKRPGVLELAWPAIASNLLMSAVGLVDIKIVGTLGASALAATTTGHRIFFILQAVLMAITTGTTALVARAWGANNREEAAEVTLTSVWLCVGVAAVLMAPGVLFADQLAGIFRLDPETVTLAGQFIRYLSFFNIAFAINIALGTALRAAGDTITPLWTGAVTNIVNVILVYALVFGEFGMPELGIAGAALGSGLAFSAGAAILMVLWLRGRLLIGAGRRSHFSRGLVKRLLNIGYPAALEQAAWQGGFIAFMWILAAYGTAPFAAYGIGANILSFSFVVGFGFSIAGSTLVGQHLGAGDPDGAQRSGWQAMQMSIGVMVLFGSIIVAFAEPIASFLIDDPEVVRLTVVFIYVLGSVQALMAIEFSIGGALRGAGDTRFPFITVLAGLLGARLSLAFLFWWLGWSVEWIFAALIADYIVKATMLSWRFRSGRWKTALDSQAPAS